MFDDPKEKLDENVFKALSTKSRIQILKLLAKRQYTQKDIAEELKLSAPSVKEHLDILTKADLVKKEDTERKWKYFELSDKGHAIVHPEKTRITFVLVSFLLCTIASIVGFVGEIFSKASFGASREVLQAPMQEMVKAGSSDVVQASASAPVAPAVQSSQPIWPFIVLAIAIVLFIVLILLAFRNKRYLRRLK